MTLNAMKKKVLSDVINFGPKCNKGPKCIKTFFDIETRLCVFKIYFSNVNLYFSTSLGSSFKSSGIQPVLSSN